MKTSLLSAATIAALQARYNQLKAEVATLGWISQGSVTPNGAAWRWTRKLRAKTVTVALSEPQAEHFKSAIADHRRLEAIITEMRELSQKFLLESVPGPRRRKAPKTS